VGLRVLPAIATKLVRTSATWRDKNTPKTDGEKLKDTPCSFQHLLDASAFSFGELMKLTEELFALSSSSLSHQLLAQEK